MDDTTEVFIQNVAESYKGIKKNNKMKEQLRDMMDRGISNKSSGFFKKVMETHNLKS